MTKISWLRDGDFTKINSKKVTASWYNFRFRSLHVRFLLFVNVLYMKYFPLSQDFWIPSNHQLWKFHSTGCYFVIILLIFSSFWVRQNFKKRTLRINRNLSDGNKIRFYSAKKCYTLFKNWYIFNTRQKMSPCFDIW